MALSPSPALSTYSAGLSYSILVAATNTVATTINVSSVGLRNVVHPDGTPLKAGDIVAGGIALVEYDGTKFQLLGSSSAITDASLMHYGVDTGSTNALVATVFPGISAYTAGVTASINVANTNSGAATINLNGLGVKTIVRSTGGALASGDINAGCIALIVYDGTRFELINVVATGGGGGGSGNTIADPLRPYFIAVISATTNTPPVSPATGDTYLVPVSGSGAWAAVHNQLAQWTGSAWVYRDYPTNSMVGVADTDDFLKRTVSGWRSIFATVAEAAAGTLATVAVTPAGLNRASSIAGPLRPYWITVISSLSAPPVSPTKGDTHLVGAAPTGAWSGQVNLLAQWDGAAWVFRDCPVDHVISNTATGDWLKRTVSTWRSAYATITEARAGTSTTLVINPADLAAVLATLPNFDEGSQFFLGMM